MQRIIVHVWLLVLHLQISMKTGSYKYGNWYPELPTASLNRNPKLESHLPSLADSSLDRSNASIALSFCIFGFVLKSKPYSLRPRVLALCIQHYTFRSRFYHYFILRCLRIQSDICFHLSFGDMTLRLVLPTGVLVLLHFSKGEGYELTVQHKPKHWASCPRKQGREKWCNLLRCDYLFRAVKRKRQKRNTSFMLDFTDVCRDIPLKWISLPLCRGWPLENWGISGPHWLNRHRNARWGAKCTDSVS